MFKIYLPSINFAESKKVYWNPGDRKLFKMADLVVALLLSNLGRPGYIHRLPRQAVGYIILDDIWPVVGIFKCNLCLISGLFYSLDLQSVVFGLVQSCFHRPVVITTVLMSDKPQGKLWNGWENTLPCLVWTGKIFQFYRNLINFLPLWRYDLSVKSKFSLLSIVYYYVLLLLV